MKILVIKSHPRDDSFCHALADEFIRGVSDAGNVVDVIKLNSLHLEK